MPGEAQDDQAGGDERVGFGAVALERGPVAVGVIPVNLDDDLQPRPVGVDFDPHHAGVEDGTLQRGRCDQPLEPPLGLRAGEPTVLLGREQRSERLDPFAPRVAIHRLLDL